MFNFLKNIDEKILVFKRNSIYVIYKINNNNFYILGVVILKFNKIIIATLLLLAILTIGAVSASENLYDDSSDVSLR